MMQENDEDSDESPPHLRHLNSSSYLTQGMQSASS